MIALMKMYAALDDYILFCHLQMPNWREVVKETHNDPMAKAIEIVERYRERGNVMPREWREHRNDPVRAQVVYLRRLFILCFVTEGVLFYVI